MDGEKIFMINNWTVWFTDREEESFAVGKLELI